MWGMPFYTVVCLLETGIVMIRTYPKAVEQGLRGRCPPPNLLQKGKKSPFFGIFLGNNYFNEIIN
jgi:hypothetical protein